MTLTRAMIYAAAQDAGNRSMRRGGRNVWAKADYAAACAEFVRLTETERARLAKSLRVLKNLRDAEWMGTYDWGGNREEVIKGVDEILESEWARTILAGQLEP